MRICREISESCVSLGAGRGPSALGGEVENFIM